MKLTRILDLNTGICSTYSNYELNPSNVARIMLKKAVKEEGFLFNPEGRKDYLNDMAEFYTELTGEKVDQTEVLNLISDKIVNSGELHIIDGNTEVNSSFKRLVCEEIEKLLIN